MTFSWIFLLMAGFFEICFTTFLNLSHGLSRFWPTVGFYLSALLSFYFLSLSLKTIPLGTAYAIWTGIGAFGTAILGIIFFHEPYGFFRIFFLVLLIFSILGLKYVSH